MSNQYRTGFIMVYPIYIYVSCTMAIIHIPILLSRSKAVFILFRGGAYHIIVATVVAVIHNIMST